MIPVVEIQVSGYEIKRFDQLTGKKHYTEFGTPVPLEYWENRPNFELISQPIRSYLKSQFMNKRIGLRMLGSEEHPNKTVDDLIEIIRQKGHDRYDLNWGANKYGKIDPGEIALFMLELEIGQELGIDGEEQIMHALNSFYFYCDEPVRVDIAIVYDLSGVKLEKIWYAGEQELAHVFINTAKASESVLRLLKITSI